MSSLSPVDAQKKKAAERAVSYIEDGMVVGLGTGSTAAFGVRALGERVQQGLKVKGVPTSEATRKLAIELSIPVLTFDEVSSLDLCFDGADEADPKLNLTKGGGGALLREKVVAFSSKRFLVICDQAKLVDKLYAFPLPVEIVPFAQKVVERAIAKLGGTPTLRQRNGAPYVTDNGLWILDCRFPPLDDPPALARALEQIPGIAEHGLFCGMASKLIVGTDAGVDEIDPS
jgi:ribose 5-phosphate isomerase A